MNINKKKAKADERSVTLYNVPLEDWLNSPGGIATLNSQGKVEDSQMPDSAFSVRADIWFTSINSRFNGYLFLVVPQGVLRTSDELVLARYVNTNTHIPYNTDIHYRYHGWRVPLSYRRIALRKQLCFTRDGHDYWGITTQEHGTLIECAQTLGKVDDVTIRFNMTKFKMGIGVYRDNRRVSEWVPFRIRNMKGYWTYSRA